MLEEDAENRKIGNEGKEGPMIECHHCGYVWIYTGEKSEHTPCPKCMYRVNIQKQKIKDEDEEG